ncbi:MAG: Crp/Fnr family transcriptional regulator [Elusimicrobia bacterium]|nr:Crp/Fnr family transcriptional regulator [Elusimicrobiota bacterium]
MTDPFLAALPAFGKLPAPVLAELSRRLVLRKYRKGEPIFEEGAPADAVHLLREGLVKAVKHSPSSEISSMEIIGPGQLFGMIAVMDDKPYPVSAIPLSASRAYRIPSRSFTALLADHPDFSKHVYSAVGDHLRQSQELRALSSETAERRIAHVLRVLSKSMGDVLPLRKADVAEIAGCSQETAIRTLAALRKRGIISSGWKRVGILDPRRLRELAEQD